MADRTVIIKQKSSDDDTSVWIVLLIAFALVLLAIVGYRSLPARTASITPQPAAVSQPAQGVQPAPSPASTN